MRRSAARRALVATILSTAAAAIPVGGQVQPAGDEFPVNSQATNDQTRPAISHDPASGEFVVTWQSLGGDDGGAGVFARHFDAAGMALGAEFPVNTTEELDDHFAAISHAPASGEYVIAWESSAETLDGLRFGSIKAQRFDGTDAKVGTEFPVSTDDTDWAHAPAISHDPASGNFVVAWEAADQDPELGNVLLRTFDADGTAEGDTIQITAATTGTHASADVAHAPTDGEFVVVWDAEGDGSGRGIFGARRAGDGGPTGELVANTRFEGDQVHPAVSFELVTGQSLVVWEGRDESGSGIFGQLYAAGSPPGALLDEFQINTYTTGDQTNPAVAHDPLSAQFVVIWESTGQDGSGQGIFGQRFFGSGTPVGEEFRVNTSTADDQANPRVSHGATGDFVVVWEGPGPDANEIFARRFTVDSGPPTPTATTGAGTPTPSPTAPPVTPSAANAATATPTRTATPGAPTPTPTTPVPSDPTPTPAAPTPASPPPTAVPTAPDPTPSDGDADDEESDGGANEDAGEDQRCRAGDSLEARGIEGSIEFVHTCAGAVELRSLVVELGSLPFGSLTATVTTSSITRVVTIAPVNGTATFVLDPPLAVSPAPDAAQIRFTSSPLAASSSSPDAMLLASLTPAWPLGLGVPLLGFSRRRKRVLLLALLLFVAIQTSCSDDDDGGAISLRVAELEVVDASGARQSIEGLPADVVMP